MDGAIQYLNHLPGWTVNLVLINNAKPVLSVIYDPLANEMFYAEEGKGAFMNGKTIRPSMKTDTSAMIAVFEYGHQAGHVEELYQKTGAAVTDLLSHFGVIRNYGPHGLQLAYVGSGRIDVFYQEGQDTYNWLAGILIAKEAGADILTTDGRPWHWGESSLMVTSPDTGKNFIINRRLSNLSNQS
jgi:myo-inositol-1(or 4)-monophosphatase